ncbi:Uncharacterised protein [Vibrio cholerae]|nr:hypothetical protein ASZ83_03081 [Vibrio cholerae]APF81114.1 hypothetical protein ASZ85_03626 [Vibrio cholerae]CSI86577.1 Uncharacterised protein [Vibrio cholerae]
MILSLRFKTKVDVHGLLEAAKVWAVTSSSFGIERINRR